MDRISELTSRQRILRYAGCYLLWLSIFLLGYVVVAIIWQSALSTLMVALIDETDVDQRYRGGAIYLFGGSLMLFGLFLLVMAGEPYLRDGVQKGLLLRRFLRLAVPLAALGVVGLVVRVVAEAVA